MWKKNYLGRIDSTQKEAISRIKRGKISIPEVFFSFIQFAGYGRHGRKWRSSKHSLAISYAWPEAISKNLNISLIPIIASTLIVDGLENFASLRPFTLGLKWPNDLMRKEKKIGGVLVQMINHDNNIWIVVGIGVNLLWDSLENSKNFGSLFDGDYNADLNDELVEIISKKMLAFTNPVDDKKVIQIFNKRDIYFEKNVSFH